MHRKNSIYFHLVVIDGWPQRSCLIPGICVTVFLTGATYVQSSGVAGFFYAFPLSDAGRSPSIGGQKK